MSETNPTFRLMQEIGLPLNRENYLRVEYLGNPPEEIDGELQAELDDAFAEYDAALMRSMGIQIEDEED